MLLELTQPDSPVKEEPYEKSGYSWTSQEVHALLTLWADESVQEQLLAYKNEHVYATFSSELAVLGFKKTSRQCRDKLKKLRQEYRQIKFDHNKRGSNHCGERWFAIMDRVLCHQPSTLESGVINSDAKILESPDSQQEIEDSDQSSSSWTPDEVHNLFGHQTGTSGAKVINSATMLLESTQSCSPEEMEDYCKLSSTSSSEGPVSNSQKMRNTSSYTFFINSTLSLLANIVFQFLTAFN
uniref:myb/SANT-like DNA-binding domain-containing protein 2 n=1 Tax=Oncorhynchus gorbuscha TaxID=8017 RepID=UPI001EAF69C2|nr:myb/SANT-like DNA-binding domain-containing protein 2 [Oncorhynchus gorbuscha]